ncbi:hypothetical protein HQ585_20145 [candidate division KSB1 bacterium]|nr:hypothetical protein [candidate division KSB1 bacterium]
MRLAVFSDEGQFVVEHGTFEIAVGGILPSVKAVTTESIKKNNTGYG